MEPKMKVEFRILGTSLPIEEITASIGLDPSRVWRQGESIQSTPLNRKENAWCFAIKDFEKTFEVEELLKPLLDKLSSKSGLIRELCNQSNLECVIACTAYVVDQTPILIFHPETLSKITELSARLEIDIILTTE